MSAVLEIAKLNALYSLVDDRPDVRALEFPTCSACNERLMHNSYHTRWLCSNMACRWFGSVMIQGIVDAIGASWFPASALPKKRSRKKPI